MNIQPIYLQTLAAVIGVLVVLVPIVVPLWFRTIKKADDRVQIFKSTVGLYRALSYIAQATPFTIDDAIATLLRGVAKEMGRLLTADEKQRVKHLFVALQLDPDEPNLVSEFSPAVVKGLVG